MAVLDKHISLKSTCNTVALSYEATIYNSYNLICAILMPLGEAKPDISICMLFSI